MRFRFPVRTISGYTDADRSSGYPIRVACPDFSRTAAKL